MIGARLMALAVALLAAAVAVAAQSAAPDQAGAPGMTAMRAAELRGLDTLNGTIRDLRLEIGETLGFGHLEITLEACHAPPQAAESDARAYLSIRDIRDAAPRFAGWMFAASPALSALDHPRYDVWVLGCGS